MSLRQDYSRSAPQGKTLRDDAQRVLHVLKVNKINAEIADDRGASIVILVNPNPESQGGDVKPFLFMLSKKPNSMTRLEMSWKNSAVIGRGQLKIGFDMSEAWRMANFVQECMNGFKTSGSVVRHYHFSL